MIRKIIPKKIKLQLKIAHRFYTDLLNLNHTKFASTNGNSKNLKHKLSLSQKIKITSASANKIENILIAAKKIEKVIINPNEVFSFWKIVGKASENNGFKKGRNIISGELTEDFGGGLCQVSGIIYHISLLANLQIVERFNHTVDIYTDESRYTPLGADATVVYAYKDLRIRNNYDFPITFKLSVNKDLFTVELMSEKPLAMQDISFKTIENPENKRVITYNQNNQVIAESIYLK